MSSHCHRHLTGIRLLPSLRNRTVIAIRHHRCHSTTNIIVLSPPVRHRTVTAILLLPLSFYKYHRTVTNSPPPYCHLTAANIVLQTSKYRQRHLTVSEGYYREAACTNETRSLELDDSLYYPYHAVVRQCWCLINEWMNAWMPGPIDHEPSPYPSHEWITDPVDQELIAHIYVMNGRMAQWIVNLVAHISARLNNQPGLSWT